MRTSLLWLALCLVKIAYSQDSVKSFADTISETKNDTSSILCYFPSQPVCTFKPDIIFPQNVSSRIDSAKVYVKMRLDTLGKVHEALILRSTNKSFNRAALKFARQFRFEWAKDAEPKNSVWVAVLLNFKR